MTISLFLGLLTLTPAICALVIAGMGFARRAAPALALGLAALGALVPVVCLLTLIPYLTDTPPLFVTLFGGTTAPTDWFSAAYRLDPLGMYCALGVALLVVPLLLWLAWHSETPASGGETLPRSQWGGLALVLAIETTLLTVLFADNILWMSLAWLLLTISAWGLGEITSDRETLDRTGLALMALGPIAWAAAFLLPALGKPATQIIYPRFTDMMGRGGTNWVQVVVLAVALAFASGAYPFSVWMRRRAAVATPAGLGALFLALIPVAIFVGARTYSAVAEITNLWPHQQQPAGAQAPPVTSGLAFIILGAGTIFISGVLALGRSDARALLAYLAVAQGGWGLLALGCGEPVSSLGVPMLLASTILGGGAMIASLVAGGTLTTDIEPEGAGPRAYGMPLRPLHLAAWTIGAATLVGVPLFGGFAPRQFASAGALQARGLPVPLTGIAWAGDLLLALALLRAVAPAFAAAFGATAPSEMLETSDTSETSDDDASSQALVAQPTASTAGNSDAADELDETDDLDERNASAPTLAGAFRWASDLPPAIFAALALVVGIAPHALLWLGATRAAQAILQPSVLDTTLKLSPIGYTLGTVRWTPVILWLVIVLVGALVLFLLPAGKRETRPILLSGRPAAAATIATEVQLSDAAAAWSDLSPALRSELVLPGAHYLLHDSDDHEAESDTADAGALSEDDGDLPASENAEDDDFGQFDAEDADDPGGTPYGRMSLPHSTNSRYDQSDMPPSEPPDAKEAEPVAATSAEPDEDPAPDVPTASAIPNRAGADLRSGRDSRAGKGRRGGNTTRGKGGHR